MGNSYLWVKAFHIVFVSSWFAGLFYLPRILVNLAMLDPASTAERERFAVEVGHAAFGVAQRLLQERDTAERDARNAEATS